MKYSVSYFLGMAVLFNPCISQSEVKKNDNTNSDQPNIIFIAVDDQNTWVSPLGNNQVKTPNLEKLANSGIVFTNAHSPGVFCAPSRTAIFTGYHASTTGCYSEDVFHYDHPDIVTLQMAFKQGGYNTYGAGKLYHHMPGFIDLRGWDEYFTRSQEVIDMGYQMNSYWMRDVPRPNPNPHSPYYTKTGRTIDTSKPFSSGHFEWGPIDNDKEEQMADAMRTNWACDVIKRKHDKPFFLALGLYSPHLPNYAPQKYFDLYDLEKIEIPPYKEDDLEDLPPKIRERMMQYKESHNELVQLGAVKEAIRGYLAAISFADAMLGRVLMALENSPNKENTIVVFWSDQGWHLGEKGRWGKHTLWERTSHVPFIWSGKGIAKNKKVSTTVSLIDMYPTFIDLCNLPSVGSLDGVSLLKVLQNPSKATDRNVFLPHMEKGAYALINSNWRYINYGDGTEELYDVKKDPNEWYNLANYRKYDKLKAEFKSSAPKVFAPRVTTTKELNLVIEGDSFYWKKKN